jgi:hypothetical protein
MLRGLRKCEACGFPVSAGRVLCVECEEKKWRGQLRLQPAVRKPASVTVIGSGGSAAAAVPSLAKPTIAPKQSVAPEAPRVAAPSIPQVPAPAKAEKPLPVTAPIPVPAEQTFSKEAESSVPEFILSAGIEPSRSWFATYKWIILVLLVILGSGASFLFFR